MVFNVQCLHFAVKFGASTIKGLCLSVIILYYKLFHPKYSFHNSDVKIFRYIYVILIVVIVKSIIIIAWVLARGIIDCKSNNSDKSIRSFKRVRSTSTSYIIIHKSIRNYNTSSIEFVIKISFWK